MLNGWTTNVAKTKNLRMMNKIIFGVEKIDKFSGTAYALGYGGAVPFVVFVAMQWHGYQLIEGGVSLIYFYGSIILSFLGAPHWGYTLAMADKAEIKNLAGRLVIGVVPSLIAFFSILFDELDRLLIIGSSFIFMYVIDSILFRQENIPNWFLPLRFRLTVIVASCFFCSIVLLIVR